MPLSNSETIQLGSALQKNLENANYEPALGILGQLREELTATDEILKVTKIGLAVGKLRKHHNKRVADLASDIVRKWKQEIDAAKARSAASRSGGQSSSASSAATVATGGPGQTTGTTGTTTTTTTTPAGAAPAAGGGQAKAARTTVTDAVDVDRPAREPVRNNCIKLLYNALASDADPAVSSAVLLDRAESIEAVVHGRFEGPSADGASSSNSSSSNSRYKQKMRSLYLNLKGTNRSLRRDVRSGDLLPETLCAMSPEEMASDERKAQNKKLEEDGIFAAMAAVATKASTDMFKCAKCGRSETTYYQMQTRSADEPMTTFITCLNCGKRWKM